MTTVRKIIVDSRYFIDGTAGQGTFELSEIVIDDTHQNIYVVESPSGGTYNARTTQITIAP